MEVLIVQAEEKAGKSCTGCTGQYSVAWTRRQQLEERVGWVCVDRLNDGCVELGGRLNFLSWRRKYNLC